MAAFALVARLIGVDKGIVAVIALLLAITVVLGSAWGGLEYIKHRGAEKVRLEIERQNNEAGIKGSEARLSRRDCVDAGGVWDFRASKCAGSAPGNRP